jgi:outer membrane protein assembly factor BamB
MGVAYETGLPASFNLKGDEEGRLVWKRDDLGGRSTPVVLGDRLYLAVRSMPGTPREGEKVVCVDSQTGETIWERPFNVYLSDVPDTRIGWSSVVADPETNSIYCLGVCDLFLCLDATTGAIKWQIPMHEQLGMLSTYGGRTNFPIVCDDLVIISGVLINWGDYARPNHRMIGLDKRTGAIRWMTGTRDLPEDTTYSAPTLRVIDGQLQLVLGMGDGDIWSFQPRTGRPLWNYRLSRIGVYATPLVEGDTVYATHAEENVTGSTMGAVVAIKVAGQGADTKQTELWRAEERMVGRSAPVLVDGKLYCVDDRNKLWVFDAKTGDELTSRMALADNKMWASLMYGDGKIYVITENGRWAILKPTDTGAEILSKGTFPRGESFQASPIAFDGRVYLPGNLALYCFEHPTAKRGKVEPPAVAVEPPVANDPKPAWVQLIPCESLMTPGESRPLTVKLYNRIGQYLRDAKPEEVQFSATGPLEVVDGQLRAKPAANHEGGLITAKVGELTGTGRARVVPPLPWKFTFDEAKDAPLSWVGARYRHVLRPVDGSPALVKITTIPKGTRSRAWMGPSTLANYTIVADVKGQTVKGENAADQLPDIGLIAQGCTLDLMGNSQQIQLRTWDPIERCTATVPFEWQGEKWYRIKMQASLEERDGDDGQPTKVAVFRGKVWAKDDPEPEGWTVEATDVSPVLGGSPGLYGNAKVCEITLDNIEVFSNVDSDSKPSGAASAKVPAAAR